MRVNSSKTQIRRQARIVRARREGVILLVVLGLLALFALVGVTFVMTASQHKTGSVAAAGVERYQDPYDAELNIVMEQVLYGTLNRYSVIGPHNLLEDMYGIGGAAVGTIPADMEGNNAAILAGGAMMLIGPVTTVAPPAVPVPGAFNSFSGDPGYYVGRVLTMLTGSCAGQSTRITGYSGTSGMIRAIPFPGMESNGTVWLNQQGSRSIPCPAATDQFVINGREFAGTGFGYPHTASATGLLDHGGAGNEFALRPNPRTQAYLQYMYGPDGVPGGGNDPSPLLFMANEAWDAPDYQNMALAMKVDGRVIIPSFHRPALINYWATTGGGLTAARELEVVFRPALSAHPQFVASIRAGLGTDPNGAAYLDSLKNGPWDVDNDGDGVADSIWIDPGLPIQVDAMGRKYKRLAAIQILDMGGRLNLNAHGHTSYPSGAGGGTAPSIQPYEVNVPANVSTRLDGVIAGGANAVLPVGLGTDPSNISLTVDDGAGNFVIMSAAEFQRLCQGANVGGRFVEGRNGEGGTANPRPGRTGVDSNYPPAPGPNVVGASADEFRGNMFEAFSYGSPFDLQGGGALGLDARGQPIWSIHAEAPTGFATDMDGILSPTEMIAMWVNEQTEMDLGRYSGRRRNTSNTTGSSIDRPFGLDELELLLRRFDIDTAARSSRLAELCPELFRSGRPVTTESWHTPVVQFEATTELATVLSGMTPVRLPINLTISDLVLAKLLSVDGSNAPARMTTLFDPEAQPDGIAAFPSELSGGFAMNINRTFGDQLFSPPAPVDGHDANGADQLWSGSVYGGATPFWHGSVANNNVRIADMSTPVARYRLAKHLYMLMMLVMPNDYVIATTGEAGLNAAQQRELTARRVAQWAINVVDFRDADAIMTPFEYDMDPFNADGWNVDGNPNTNTDNGTDSADRRLVWGCEAPDLLLTEAKAFHNKHIADTRDEEVMAPKMASRTDDPDPPAPMMKDTTFDQVRLPQGSAFIELYCTRNPHNPYVPFELYQLNGAGKPVLDLGRMAGLNPVWRIVVGKTTQNGGTQNDVTQRLQTRPHSASLEPVQIQRTAHPAGTDFNLIHNMPTDQPVEIDRIVWMASQNNTFWQDEFDNERIANPELVYANRGANPLLEVGHYAVVGPRPKTPIGRTPQAQVIAIDNFGEMRDAGGAVQTIYDTSKIKNPLGIAVSGGDSEMHETYDNAPAPMLLTTQIFSSGVPFSISEPLYNSPVNGARGTSYYPLIGFDNGVPTTLPHGIGAYFDRFAKPLDEPLDTNRTAGWNDSVLRTESLSSPQTTQNYKTIFLQRLANPLLDWNPEPEAGMPAHNPDMPVNPYITVDWLPIDLTVMNTELEGAATPDPNAPGPVKFESRERGDNTAPAPQQGDIWPAISRADMTGAVNAPNGAFNLPLRHTFGYLNSTFGVPYDNMNSPNMSPLYIGDAQRPFPWFTWLDRPFSSKMELMLVPASSAGRMLTEYTVRRSASQQHYTVLPALDRPSTPFGHLLNFFHSSKRGDPGITAPDFHRALAWMDVPARYAGTQQFFDPRAFRFNGTSIDTKYPFYAPDNVFPTFREPGRVNLNTISDMGLTWKGIANGYQHTSDPTPEAFFTTKLAVSRQGYGATYVPGTLDNAYPTEFAKPFVESGASYRVPLDILRQDGAVERNFVQGGLMRSSPTQAEEPLFAMQGSEANGYDASHGRGPFSDTDRNPYFRYQPLQKYSNLVTGRSNVYAVWITIGYFEVKERNSTDGLTPAYSVDNYPDGYEILGELNSDTGNIERHRAFYIIDRSIPVAFQRGVRHNAMDAVRLQRIIE